jgi:FkbM family methyltransferase
MFTRMSQLLGAKGLYLGFCRKIRRVPVPVSIPIFGTVGTWPEVVSIHDNFVVGELRDSYIETKLSEATAPVVVDCGINAGITVRWWLHLNPSARVFGFDMMQEAHDLTHQRLQEKGRSYMGITAPLSSADGEEVTISYTDPLDGENRIEGAARGPFHRALRTARLDTLLAPYRLDRIELLKVDVERTGDLVLRGAPNALSITQNVVVEHHSKRELGDSVAILVEAGFRLRRVRNRNLWFKRGGRTSPQLPPR